MAEYSRIATGTVISTGGQTAVVLPFTPTKIRTFNRNRAVAQNGQVDGSPLCITKAWWNYNMGAGAAGFTDTMAAGETITGDVTGYIAPSGGSSSSVPTGLVSGSGFFTIQAALALQYGPTVLLGGSGGITKNAGAPTVTTTAAHGLRVGDVVIFQNLYQTTTTGMQQIAGIPFVVTGTGGGGTTFTIAWDTSGSNYTAISTGGLNANASFKKVLFPVLYAPGTNVVTSITTGTTTTVKTTTPHNFVVGQQVAFRMPLSWGAYQLNSLPNPVIPGSPIYGYVVSVTDSLTVVVNINSTGYTAFNPNQPFASFPGQQFPQIVAVGDVNTGGWPINSTSPLYPSPIVFNGYTASLSTGVRTINGPAIQGAYINATWQGFVIGQGVSGTSGDIIDYEAVMSDINL